MERLKQSSARMDKLVYQDLLSKCIQNGLPGGFCSESITSLQGNVEPAVGISRSLENFTSGSKDDTSGAAQGPLAESNSCYRVVTGMDGIGLEKSRLPSMATPRSTGTCHIRGRTLLSEDLIMDGFSESVSKSRRVGTKTTPSAFSFRSLLEGAMSAPGINSPTSVPRMSDSGMLGAQNVEPQNNCVPGERHPLPGERKLVRERCAGVVSSSLTPQCRRDEEVLSGERVTESWKGNEIFAVRARDSRSFSSDTVGDSGPHLSYSSLLQAQLGDDVGKVITVTPQKTAGTLFVNVEACSSSLILQLLCAEAKGGFPFLPTGARRECFRGVNAVSIGEQISVVHYFDKPSHVSAVAVSRFADKSLARVVSESPTATAVPVLTKEEEDASRADVVVDRGSLVVSDSICNDEAMADVQLYEVSSRALVLDESRLAEKVMDGDATDSSEAGAVPALGIPTKLDQDNARAMFAVEKVADSVPTDERMLAVSYMQEPYDTFGVDALRSTDNVPNADFLNLSEAAAGIAKSLACAGVEKADRPAGLDSASCVIDSSTCGDNNVLGVQRTEELSRDLTLHESCSVSEISRIEDSSVDLIDNGMKVSDVLVSDEASHAVALDGLRFPCNTFTELSVGAGDSTLPVPKITGEDILKSVVMVDPPQGRVSRGSSNPSNGQVLEDKIKSSLYCSESLKDQLGGRADFINVDATLDPAFQASHKDSTVNRISVGKAEFIVCDSRVEYGVGGILETDNPAFSGDAGINLPADRDLLLQKVVVDEPIDASVHEILPFKMARATGTIVECSRQAALKQTVSLNDVPKVVLDEELSISKGELRHSVHTEGVTDDFIVNALVEKSSCTLIPPCGYVVIEKPHAPSERSECGIPCSEGIFFPTEVIYSGGGLQRSCVGSLETSPIVSVRGIENIVDAERIYIDEKYQMVNLKVAKVEQDQMLGEPEGSSEAVEQSEVGLHKTHASADEAPEMRTMVSQHSDSRLFNLGMIVYRNGRKAQEFLSSKLPTVEPDIRNEVERAPENYVGEIVSGGSDSGNSCDLADQIQDADPDAISEALGQSFLRDSDATISDSLESVLGAGPELANGKEVQSELATKSKDRHDRHLDDPEDYPIGHLEALEPSRTEHLDDLEEDDEPFASPFHQTLRNQLVGVGARPYKKKGRPRAYKHDGGTGKSDFHTSGLKRKNQLQNADNRCRRHRHIYPDQPVPVFIEGRDKGFEEADGCSFLRWVAHQDESNAPPSPALEKTVFKHSQELVKSIIVIPSFRVISDCEENQQEVTKGRKHGIQQEPIPCSRPTCVNLSTVRPSEYDMDDEDEKWLHAWNKRLTRGGLKQLISEDKFEEMIEYFERRSTEMDVCTAGNFPGFSYCGKASAQPVPGSSLPRICPSVLGLLSSNQATSGNPVSGNSPIVRSAHPPWAGDLKDLLIPNSDVDAVNLKSSEGLLRKSFEHFALEKLAADCCICNGGEDDDNNPVYTCKQCVIHVHQSCYGIREKFRDDEGRIIAPSNWCCRKCEAIAVGRAQPNVSCALCRKRGGALKPTVVARKWAHVACALYTNETFFVDPDAMEPIDGLAAVMARAQERRERCELCGVKRGICSLCAVKECRAPFHISCGVSQGASFELRQSKQKVVGVRSFCPRHARTTAIDSSSSVEVKSRHGLSSSTSGATSSATASGNISIASSVDNRKERSLGQSISYPDESLREPAKRALNVATHVAHLTDNAVSVYGKAVEDAGRERPKGIRFTLKRRRDGAYTQASEIGLMLDHQNGCGDGTEITGAKVEAPVCKSTWHVVEPGQELKKVKVKFGRLVQNLDLESSPTVFLQAKVGDEDPQAEKMKNVMPTVDDVCGDACANKRDSEFVNASFEKSFAKEVKELMILEEAMKSGVASGHIMREAFVYWRAKRAESKGSLLREVHHEQWLRSRSIFNKDASDQDRVATLKMGSPLSVPQTQQAFIMSTEKTLDMAKEILIHLERVRLMAQMVVQREKLKYNHQLVVGSMVSAEFNVAEGILEERHCVWCPSTKTLLECGTCPRNFCFNCFKHRKGFGVKGWMAAMKQPMYICKYCREHSSEPADLSHIWASAPKRVGEGGAFSTTRNNSGPAIEVVGSNPVITSEAALGVVSTSVTSSKYVSVVRGPSKGRSSHCPGSGFLEGADDVVMVTESNSVTQGKQEVLRIGRGKGISWTASNSARHGSTRRGSEDGARNQCHPDQLENGLNRFLSNANSQMKFSSFETTLRKLKILRGTSTDTREELGTSSDEIPSGDIDPGPGMVGFEGVTTSSRIGANVSVPSSPGSCPALLVYKKRRLILGESLKSPPSAFYFGEQPCSGTWLEDGPSVYRVTSARRLAKGNGIAND